MENKDFDRLLREKFNKESLTTHSVGWQSLSERLSVPAKRKGFLFYKLAAAILILLGLSAGIAFLWKDNTDTVTPPVVASSNNGDNAAVLAQNKPKKQVAEASSGISSASTASGAKKEAIVNLPASQKSNQKTLNGLVAKAKNLNAARQPEANTIGSVAENNTHLKVFAAKSKSGVVAVNQPEGTSGKGQKDISVIQNILPNPGMMTNQENTPGADIDKMNLARKSASGTSVALGGGMNYGALNAGYAIGLSARQALGKHLFVEGTVSFLYNNEAPNTTNYPGPPTTPSRPSSFNQGNAKAPSVSMISDFYFLQVNPSIGYQVNKLLAFSVGADMQQRIASMSQNGTAVFTPGSDPRIIPRLDFGFTGKTDFFISPKIEAGLLYRNGLNNFFDPQNIHPYLNRRYFQVQLKYNFLLK